MIFFSLLKIAIDLIGTKKYDRALKDFVYFVIFFALFSYNVSATLWNVGLDNTISDSKNKQVEINGKEDVNGIPFMYILLSIPDQLAYNVTKLMLGNDLNMNMSIRDLALNPQKVYEEIVFNYVGEAKDPDERLKRVKAFLKCSGLYDTIMDMADKEIETKYGDKENTKDIKKKLKNLFSEKTDAEAVGCDNVAKGISTAAQNYENELISNASASGIDPKNFKPLSKVLSYIEMIKSINSKNSLQATYSSPDVNEKLVKDFSNNLIKTAVAQVNQEGTTNAVLSNKNYFARKIDSIWSGGKQIITENLDARKFNTKLLFKMNGLAILIVMSIFPIVIAFSFLPIFGYHFRLLQNYIIGYFFLKLWIPVYLIAYKYLLGMM